MHLMKERLVIFSCIAVFVSWYMFTGYMIVVSIQADYRMLLLLLLPISVIVYFILKVIRQMKKTMHVK